MKLNRLIRALDYIKEEVCLLVLLPSRVDQVEDEKLILVIVLLCAICKEVFLHKEPPDKFNIDVIHISI